MKICYLDTNLLRRSRDAYHLFIMLENKVKFMATFDSDFEAVFAKKKIAKFE